jgi:hypothetical protein
VHSFFYSRLSKKAIDCGDDYEFVLRPKGKRRRRNNEKKKSLLQQPRQGFRRPPIHFLSLSTSVGVVKDLLQADPRC